MYTMDTRAVACRQESGGVEAQLELQAEAARWQQESVQAEQSLKEAQAARDEAQEQVERLQGSLRDLQRHVQDRGGYDELQARFKEVISTGVARERADRSNVLHLT